MAYALCVGTQAQHLIPSTTNLLGWMERGPFGFLSTVWEDLNLPNLTRMTFLPVYFVLTFYNPWNKIISWELMDECWHWGHLCGRSDCDWQGCLSWGWVDPEWSPAWDRLLIPPWARGSPVVVHVQQAHANLCKLFLGRAENMWASRWAQILLVLPMWFLLPLFSAFWVSQSTVKSKKLVLCEPPSLFQSCTLRAFSALSSVPLNRIIGFRVLSGFLLLVVGCPGFNPDNAQITMWDWTGWLYERQVLYPL